MCRGRQPNGAPDEVADPRRIAQDLVLWNCVWTILAAPRSGIRCFPGLTANNRVPCTLPPAGGRRARTVFRIPRRANRDFGASGANGCQWCDVEIETASHFDRGELNIALSLRASWSHIMTFVLIRAYSRQSLAGWSVPEAMPLKLPRIANRCPIAYASANWHARARDVVAIPMGEFGFAGRVLSLRMGSALAYAAVEQTTAPGQLSLDAIVDLYRAERITGSASRVYGVIGDPIGHSLFAAVAQHCLSRAQIRRCVCTLF